MMTITTTYVEKLTDPDRSVGAAFEFAEDLTDIALLPSEFDPDHCSNSAVGVAARA